MEEVKEIVDTVTVELANGGTQEVTDVVIQEVNHALLSAGMDEALADKVDNFVILLLIIGVALLANLICRKIILRTVAKLVKRTKATWDDIVFDHKVMVHVSRMVAPILIYLAIPIAFPEHADSNLLDFLRRLCLIYILAVFLRFISVFLSAVYHVYSEKEQYKDKPLKGLLQTAQVVLFFVGAIIIVSILIKQSPMVLLTGLGASAAILMLVFKDSILGFVAGIQLSANDMVRPGDWITLPSGAANGTVQEITLNTVKIQNFDNTISTVPPYTLVSSPFQNWRGMVQSGGRRVMKNITLDLTTLQFCTPEMLDRYRKEIPLMADYQPEAGVVPTNSQVYRVYIERYLCSLPVVNQDLDLIISQKEATMYGVPIQVYFFSRNKVWKEYERIQSDIFDHLLAMVPKFDLKVYQYSD